jgi:hypothetical protein
MAKTKDETNADPGGWSLVIDWDLGWGLVMGILTKGTV